MNYYDLPPDPPQEPPGVYHGPAEPSRPSAAKQFVLERWRDIIFENQEEWRIKRFLPRRGLSAIYGKPGAFKSFTALHVALCIALGWPWAGRRVAPAPVVYIAAEGAASLRKRKAGYVATFPDLPADVPLSLIAAAPNLGTLNGDLAALVAAIEFAGVAPGMIVIDTLAQSLAASDENGVGMTAFVANAGALAKRFDCLVLIVHHVGLGDDRRMRGHTSLHGALDAQILCERQGDDLAATLTLQKLKDEASDIRLVARLSRVVLDHDEDGDEVSTLIVDSVEDSEPAAKAPRARAVPSSQRLLMAVVAEAIDEGGENIRPFADGPMVCAVTERCIRKRYFARIAEQVEPGEDGDKLEDRQRKSFKRAVESALKTQILVAADHKRERFIWLPLPSPIRTGQDRRDTP